MRLGAPVVDEIKSQLLRAGLFGATGLGIEGSLSTVPKMFGFGTGQYLPAQSDAPLGFERWRIMYCDDLEPSLR
jgi:hypothetical protein